MMMMMCGMSVWYLKLCFIHSQIACYESTKKSVSKKQRRKKIFAIDHSSKQHLVQLIPDVTQSVRAA